MSTLNRKTLRRPTAFLVAVFLCLILLSTPYAWAQLGVSTFDCGTKNEQQTGQVTQDVSSDQADKNFKKLPASEYDPKNTPTVSNSSGDDDFFESTEPQDNTNLNSPTISLDSTQVEFQSTIGLITDGGQTTISCSFVYVHDGDNNYVKVGHSSAGEPSIDPKTQGSLIIPNKVNYNGKDYDLKAIGGSAFSGCRNITGVNFCDLTEITTIGQNAFSHCESLTEIDLSSCSKLVSLEKSSFTYCASSVVSHADDLPDPDGHGLTSIKFGSALKKIDSYAFDKCTYLKRTGLAGSSVEEIEGYAYNQCASLETTDLAKSNVKSIGQYLFWMCVSLLDTGLAKNQTLETWGIGDFMACVRLEKTGLDENNLLVWEKDDGTKVRAVPEQAFLNCESLKDTGLAGSDYVELGASAFRGDEKLVATGLNESEVEIVGTECFEHCLTLTDTGLKDSSPDRKSAVKILSDNAFAYDDKLTDTGLSQNTSVTTIGESAFLKSGIINTGLAGNNTVVSLGRNAFSTCSGIIDAGLGTNGGITTIENGTFQYCSNMVDTGLEENSNISKIGNSAFFACNKLGIEVDGHVNKGDLVLRGGKPEGDQPLLTIGENAFYNTGKRIITSVYILCDNHKEGSLKISDSALGISNSVTKLYVPGSWADLGEKGIKLFGKTFQTQDSANNKLTIMGPVSDMNVNRTSGTTYSAQATMNYGHVPHQVSTKILNSHEDDLGTYEGSEFSIESDKLPLSADTLTAQMDFGGELFVYPEDAKSYKYNTVDKQHLDCQLNSLTYSISFNKNGDHAQGTMDDIGPIEYDSTDKLPPNMFTVDDKMPIEFDKWSTDIDGKDNVRLNEDPIGKFSDRDGGPMETQDGVINLYAQWKSSVSLPLIISSVALDKDDSGQEVILQGAGYTVYTDEDKKNEVTDLFADEEKNKPIDSWPIRTSDDAKVAIYGFCPADIKTPRDYYVFGTYAPSGYSLPEDYFKITVKPDGNATIQPCSPQNPNPPDPVPFEGKASFLYKTIPDLPLTGCLDFSEVGPLVKAGGALTLISVALFAVKRLRRIITRLFV